MTKFVGLLLFLVFVDDNRCAYKNHLGAPFEWVDEYLFKPTPISVRPFDLIILTVLIIASTRRDRRGGYVAPMKNTLLLVLATTVLWFTYGVVSNGDARAASWQTYLVFSTVLLAFALAVTFRTAADFRGLAKWLLAAAVYRATMCWISYFTWARDLVGQSGAFLTNHEDTITWVVSILILIIHVVERRSTLVTMRSGVLILFFLGAIQFNSRRLAWVSLMMGLIVMYALFPQGPAKRRVNRAAKLAIPFVLLYVVVGWGRPNRIFLPLRSLSSVSTEEDASTLARNAENLGLIATANGSSSALGTGWGHPYHYLTLKYDISSFELWRYVPHNSILGILAFTGALGFAGFWLPVPTSVFLNSRTALLGSDTKARGVAIIGASQLVVCANQLYGDMGLFSPSVMYVVAVSYAIALRLPTTAGVWTGRASNVARQA